MIITFKDGSVATSEQQIGDDTEPVREWFHADGELASQWLKLFRAGDHDAAAKFRAAHERTDSLPGGNRDRFG